MKWIKHLAIAIVMLLAGCGGKMSLPSPFLISWQSDGNPTVPVCGSVLTDCKKSITILDETTGSTTVVPVTIYSVTMPDATHTYEARTDGYNDNGVAISSPYLPVP